MKIAFVTGDNPWPIRSGCSQVTSGLIYSLSNRHLIHCICLKGEHKAFSEIPQKRNLSTEILATRHFNKRWSQLLSLFSHEPMVKHQYEFPDAEQAIYSLLARIKPDIVIFNHIRSAWLVPAIDKIKHLPSIYIAHNAEADTNLYISSLQKNVLKKLILHFDSYKLRRLEHRILSHVNACVTLTAEDSKRLAKINPYTQFTVIPPGFESSSQPTDTSGEIKELLLVGSFMWEAKRRNAIWLVRNVLPLLLKSYPFLTLRIVGGAANLLSHELKDVKHVKIESDVPTTEIYYKNSCIVLVPEKQLSGIKIKTLEAACFGLPIVSTPSGIEGTGLIDGESCLVAITANQFAEKITTLISNEQLRVDLGKRAYDFVRARYDWLNIQNEYENFMYRILSKD